MRPEYALFILIVWYTVTKLSHSFGYICQNNTIRARIPSCTLEYTCAQKAKCQPEAGIDWSLLIILISHEKLRTLSYYLVQEG